GRGFSDARRRLGTTGSACSKTHNARPAAFVIGSGRSEPAAAIRATRAEYTRDFRRAGARSETAWAASVLFASRDKNRSAFMVLFRLPQPFELGARPCEQPFDRLVGLSRLNRHVSSAASFPVAPEQRRAVRGGQPFENAPRLVSLPGAVEQLIELRLRRWSGLRGILVGQKRLGLSKRRAVHILDLVPRDSDHPADHRRLPGERAESLQRRQEHFL